MSVAKRILEYNNFKNRGFIGNPNNQLIAVATITDQLDAFLENLSDDEVKQRILYKALINAGKELQSTTKKYFRNAMGAAADSVSKYIRKPFNEGIILKGDRAYCEARVSIMKDFRMKFFETGTDERFIKQRGHSDLRRNRHTKNTGKLNYRGKIESKHFFKDARNNSQTAITDAIKDTIKNELEKLAK